MERLIIEFVHYLRKSEINVPTSSLEEVLTLLPFINVKNRFDFENSLKQIFVKHEE